MMRKRVELAVAVSGVASLRKSVSDSALSLAAQSKCSPRRGLRTQAYPGELVAAAPPPSSAMGLATLPKHQRMLQTPLPTGQCPEGTDESVKLREVRARLAEREAEIEELRVQLLQAQRSLLAAQSAAVPHPVEVFKRKYPTLCGVIGGVGPEASADFFLNGIIKGRARLFRHLRLRTASVGRASTNLVSAAREVSSAPWREEDLLRLDELIPAQGDAGAELGDQSHVPLLMYDNPQIPDRTTYILNAKEYGGPEADVVADPGPALAASALTLVEGGANLICVVCNTAHFFLPEVRAAMPEGVVVLDMIELTVLAALRKHQAAVAAGGKEGPLRLGLLATTGTCSTGIYSATAARVAAEHGVGIEVLKPEMVEGGSQQDVHDSIYGPRGIKAGYADVSEPEGLHNFNLLMTQASLMAAGGAHYVIIGCTELPLVMNQARVGARDARITLVNPTQCLADEVVYLTLKDHRAR